MDAEGSENKDSFVRRACDQCRLRKIRCDKRSPCSNCRSSQIVCRSTGAGQKPQEPRRRVLISDQYERKIDLIEERLGGIEESLRDISISLKSDSKPYYQPAMNATQMASPYSPKPTCSLDHDEPVTAFEGSSSLAAHSAYASQLLETAVSRSPLQMATPKMEAALSSLKQIVNMQDNKDYSIQRSDWLPNRRAMPPTGLRELPLPPVELVLQVLREIKEKPLPCMLGLPFISSDRLTVKCREVFFATEEYTEAAFIITNGCLYFIFSEFMFMTKDERLKANYTKSMEICRTNFQTALANMSLIMPATSGSIEALAVGAIHAIEISKPSFALLLTSTASHLCQTLGYHRHSSMENDSESIRQDKINLFWTIYCIDKALSLRVGRASALQDYDISTPMTPRVFGDLQPWNTVYSCWIRFARIQGRVYETLYSPTALNQPEDQRASQARKLAGELQWAVIEPYKNMDTTGGVGYEYLYFTADQVGHLALLALIYRAIPPQNGSSATFSNECIETARMALEKHQQCMAILKESDETMILMYFHWTILYSPFVPFIVLFCHVIKDSSENDLQRLDDFVTSIQPTTGLSEAIAKLHRLCQVLRNIARLYLEAKAQAKTQDDQTIGQEFDTYLTALGMGPVLPEYGGVQTASTTAALPGVIPGDMMQGMEGPVPGVAPSALRNWFSGNQHMMGLLEEDLSLFDPSVW